MKKIFTIVYFVLASSLLLAQAPNGFNYQALIRSDDGEVLTSTEVNIFIEIISGSKTGSIVYSENHPIQTDANGMIHLVIGQGTTISGNFANVSWGVANHFVKTSIDTEGGTNFQPISVDQLMSVPYAIHSNSTGSFSGNNIEVKGNGNDEDLITLSNDNYSRISAVAASNDLEPVSAFVGKRSGGTLSNPINISPEQRISGIYGSSFANGSYFVNAAVEMLAGEQSGSNGVSSYIKFGTTEVGSTQRTEKMRVTENGNVGIGTTTPAYKLEVNGSINADDLYLNGELIDLNQSALPTEPISLTGTGTGDDMITLKNNDYSRISSYSASDNAEPVASFVGFRSSGTNENPTNISPEQRISGIYGSSFANGSYFVNAAVEMLAGEQSGSNGVSSYIKFGTTAVGATQRTEKMRITESGNVGIGTISPAYKLEVNGSISASELYLNGELIDLSNSALPTEPITLTGPGTDNDMITVKNNNFSRISSYSASDNSDPVASFVGFRSSGTNENPTNISPEQRISGIYGSSFANGSYFVNAAVEMLAGEQSGSNGVSSYIKFGTTEVGATERTEKMRITESGNVGIGTISPKSKLQVTDGDIYIEDAASGVIMTSPDGNCWRMTVDNTGNPQFTSITCPQ